MRVANTRPTEQATELSNLLRRAGFDPVEVPAIKTVASISDLSEIRVRLASYAWVILPSANAARYLSQSIDLSGAPILCGAATAKACKLDGATTLERFSATAALDYLLPRVQPGMHVLVPRAAEGRDELIVGFEREGVIVDAPVVYRTVATEIPAWQPVDAITLCSPSAVAALVSAWTAATMNTARIVCLGQTTAQSALAHGLHVDAVAAETNVGALVAAVQSTLSARAAA